MLLNVVVLCNNLRPRHLGRFIRLSLIGRRLLIKAPLPRVNLSQNNNDLLMGTFIINVWGWHGRSLCHKRVHSEFYKILPRLRSALYCCDIIIPLRTRQNIDLSVAEIFKFIFLTKNALKYVPKGSINNKPALIQIRAWHRAGAIGTMTKSWTSPVSTLVGLLVCDLNRTPNCYGKTWRFLCPFFRISTCGRTSRETVSHPQCPPLPTLCKISLSIYVIVKNKMLQPLTTTWYDSLVLSFSFLKI